MEKQVKLPKFKKGGWIRVLYFQTGKEENIHISGEDDPKLFFIEKGVWKFIRKLSKEEIMIEHEKWLREEILTCVRMMSYENLQKLWKHI